MENLIVDQNKSPEINSREVAKMIERSHSEVLKDIRRFIGYLAGGEIHLGEYFRESRYTDANNQERPCFGVTRKGCEMLANKLTGRKGVLFTAAYIDKFHKMEMTISQNGFPIELDDFNKRLELLELSMPISKSEEYGLQVQGKKRAIKLLGGYKSNAYNHLSRSVFQQLWHDFKYYFEIPRYGDIPKHRLNEGKKFISIWQPKTEVLLEIERLNSQLELEFA
ncbi:Rha family transcriptional regulator [Listeria seeligeri]